MKNPDETTMVSENIKRNRKEQLRLWLIVLGIHLISLLFGFAVFLIIFGTQLILRRIIIVWYPARKWFAKIFSMTIKEIGASNLPSGGDSILSKISFFNVLAHVVVGLYLIIVGLSILLRDGFLEQNLIYLIFFSA